MPAKMARSAPRPPFGVARITAAVRADQAVLSERDKSAKIHAGSGFIWRIPVYRTDLPHWNTGSRRRTPVSVPLCPRVFSSTAAYATVVSAVEATMFAPPIAKPKTKAAAPSKNTSLLHRAAPFGHRLDDSGGEYLPTLQRPTYFDRASAPAVSWNFAAIPVYSPAPNSPTQTRPFTAKLRAIVKGSQSDALSADRPTSPAESEPQISQSDVPKPEESKLQRKDGEPIPIPDGLLPSISGEQTDSITSHLNYTSSVNNTGPPPSDFGLTKYDFVPDNFKYNHHPATPGTPAGPGSAGTPPTPANYEVTGDIRGVITYQVNRYGSYQHSL